MEKNMFSEFFLSFTENLIIIELKTLIFSIILLVLICLFLNNRKRKLKLPPGPAGLPIVGYFPFLGNEPYKKLNELGKKYGNIFGFYLGKKYVVILNDWKSVTDAFSKNEIANRPPKIFDAIPKGFGFAEMNGAEWIEQRRFTTKAMKKVGFGRTPWEKIVQEEVNNLIIAIERHGPSPVDACEVFSSTFANNVMTLIFGRRLPTDHPDVKLISTAVDVATLALSSLGMSYFMPKLSSMLVKLGLRAPESFHELEQFGKYFTKAIKQKLESQKNGYGDSFIDEYNKQGQLNKETKLNNRFTELSLQGNTQAVIVGGSETSRTVTLWLLIAVAEHQEIQRKVQKELDSVLGKDRSIKWSDRNKVPYTYAVLMESFRWKSVVPINTLRMASEDVKVCGYDIPKDAIVTANNWALHNDPRYWHDPEKFIPERFLTERGKQVNLKPDSYVPFSYGKRNCPGELIALTEILLYFAMLMQKFVVLPEEGEQVKHLTEFGLIYRPKNVQLRFIPR